MTDPQSDDTTLARRNLIRGGAVLAGAAGLTAAGAVLAPKANAATGGNAVLGTTNTASSTTSLANSANSPTLYLGNSNSNAPTLALQTRAAYGDNDTLPNLSPGQFVSTNSGPYLGLSDGTDTATAYLVTNYDVDTLPVPLPIPPERLLDTRSASLRNYVRASVANPFTSAGQLTSGNWIDVPVGGVSDTEVLNAGFFNLTSVSPAANGYLLAYPPNPTRPNASTVNFSKGVTLSNGCFVGLGLYQEIYIVRIFASTVTHVILDLSGLTVQGPTAELPASSSAAAKTTRRRGVGSRRMVRSVKRR